MKLDVILRRSVLRLKKTSVDSLVITTEKIRIFDSKQNKKLLGLKVTFTQLPGEKDRPKGGISNG